MAWMTRAGAFTQSAQLNANLLANLMLTLTDTPRNKVLLAPQAPLSPVKLTHKINHHNNDFEVCINTLSFLELNSIPLGGGTTFVYSFITLWTVLL